MVYLKNPQIRIIQLNSVTIYRDNIHSCIRFSEDIRLLDDCPAISWQFSLSVANLPCLFLWTANKPQELRLFTDMCHWEDPGSANGTQGDCLGAYLMCWWGPTNNASWSGDAFMLLSYERIVRLISSCIRIVFIMKINA